ncbi:MAG: phosphotransferase family protein [Pseudonocardiaceae bacterium]
MPPTHATGAGTLSLELIHEALAEACPAVVVRSVRPAASGYTSRQWLADTDEGFLLVKVPVRLPDPVHSRNMIAATRLAAEEGLPVIRFRGFTPVSAVTGGPVVVQEFVAGTRASDQWPDLAEPTRLRVARELGRWIATLHGHTADRFGEVLGTRQHTRWDSYLTDFLDRLLREIPENAIVGGRSRLEAVMAAGIAAVACGVRPALTHGDIWLDNVLLRSGRVHRILDFEHARFLDPLYDFGKPDELVFERWPAGREAFLDGYVQVSSLPPDSDRRITLYRGFHYLFMLTWFARWQPELVPEYRERLALWADEVTVSAEF